jgi:hypothetical protein
MSLVGFMSLICPGEFKRAPPVRNSGRCLSSDPAHGAGVYRGAIGNSMGRASCFNFFAARFSLKVVCAGFLVSFCFFEILVIGGFLYGWAADGAGCHHPAGSRNRSPCAGRHKPATARGVLDTEQSRGANTPRLRLLSGE